MARLIGIDVGTSGTKAILIDETGRLLKRAERSYGMSTPQPGWAEQDPEDWWNAVQECLAELNAQAVAIGVTGQMHGSVFLDAQGAVVRPALLWCDQRTLAECAEATDTVGFRRLVETTCNPMLTGFQLPKVLWLRKQDPEAFGRTEKVLLPKDFIVQRLTGETVTEPSDASGTGCFDVRRKAWAADILGALGIDPRLFPDVVDSWSVVGQTAGGVPVVAGAGDQAAGAVGVGAVVPGMVSVSLGTSGVAFTAIPEARPNDGGSVHVFCHATGGWHAMGVMLSCGGAVSWARKALFADRSFREMDALADDVPPGAEGVSFLPYLAGERCPVVDPAATGAFNGLTLHHGPQHLARAVLEGVTFGVSDCLRSLVPFGGEAGCLRVTGGGAKSAFWLQLLADVTGVPCVTLEQDEGPALGAALLAGVGVGMWHSVVEAAEATVREKDEVSPRQVDFTAPVERYRSLYRMLKG
ncbi:MAG: xylulokinase [Armatimonadetes bacterium]|nr:xylulokinase [Armatimonadota bacterium]